MQVDTLNIDLLTQQVKTAPLSQLADLARRHWKPMFYGAVPYVNALLQCPTINSTYGIESAEHLVLAFLANARTWRGPIARVVKAELKRRAGVK